MSWVSTSEGPHTRGPPARSVGHATQIPGAVSSPHRLFDLKAALSQASGDRPAKARALGFLLSRPEARVSGFFVSGHSGAEREAEKLAEVVAHHAAAGAEVFDLDLVTAEKADLPCCLGAAFASVEDVNAPAETAPLVILMRNVRQPSEQAEALLLSIGNFLQNDTQHSLREVILVGSACNADHLALLQLRFDDLRHSFGVFVAKSPVTEICSLGHFRRSKSRSRS